jgi:5'-phosphate synthase pdxT subunit
MKERGRRVTVGVLALQGDFLEHVQVLHALGAVAKEVRTVAELNSVHALIMPGGESTTMAKLMDAYGLRAPLRKRILAGMPVWGTCAGMILLAKRLKEGRPEPLRVMDIEVSRNAFGRQVDSFEKNLGIKVLGKKLFHAVFIRAPVILKAGKGVEVLARLHDGTPVAARQDNMLATAFHPELSGDHRVHEYFLEME